MLLRRWEKIPQNMKNDSVRKYYEVLSNKFFTLLAKRVFDLVVSIIMLLILFPVFLIISILIKIESQGPVMFRQVRVTQYGKRFGIYKFRTMVNNADKIGDQLTAENDSRVTRVGKFLRGLRLDEIPQLLNIIAGDMTFVGTRPEVMKYVERYSDEMLATLLLPAGVTSEASIQYRNEGFLLPETGNIEEIYIKKVLPEKMKYNLLSIKNLSFLGDIKIMFRTVLAVIKKNENDKGRVFKTNKSEIKM